MIPQSKEEEGAYFCKVCGREYENGGICKNKKCRGKIEFVRESDSRFIKLVMKSKRKVEDKPKIEYVRSFIKNRGTTEEIRWL